MFRAVRTQLTVADHFVGNWVLTDIEEWYFDQSFQPAADFLYYSAPRFQLTILSDGNGYIKLAEIMEGHLTVLTQNALKTTLSGYITVTDSVIFKQHPQAKITIEYIGRSERGQKRIRLSYTWMNNSSRSGLMVWTSA